jgi:hypothetical protein
MQNTSSINNTSSTNAAVVAQNDNATAVLDLHSIISERKAWEAGAYRTSNMQLYAVLSKCQSFYNDLFKVSKRDEPRKSFDDFAAANGIKFKDGTPLINKVVKCVFYDESLDRNAQRDRRRISAYSLVLRRALSDNIIAADLPSWIEQCGGIEQIRLGKTTALTPKVKAQTAREAVETSSSYIAVVQSDKLSEQFDAEDFNCACVALIVPRKDGKVEIHHVVKADGAVNASLAAVFGTAVDQVKQAEVRQHKELQAA